MDDTITDNQASQWFWERLPPGHGHKQSNKNDNSEISKDDN